MNTKILLMILCLELLYTCSPAFKFAEPIGGIKAIEDKLYYTDEAKLVRTEGKMIVKFIVKPDSSVENVRVIKYLGFGLDEIAVEAVKNTKFEPCEIEGKIVECEITMPIFFRYNKAE